MSNKSMSKMPLPPTPDALMHEASIHQAPMPLPPIPNGIFTIHVGGFRIARRGRFWTVQDSADVLIVTAVYKKGALEVVRRLLPVEFRHLVDELQQRNQQRETVMRRASGPKPAMPSKSPRCRYELAHEHSEST